MHLELREYTKCVSKKTDFIDFNNIPILNRVYVEYYSFYAGYFNDLYYLLLNKNFTSGKQNECRLE